MHQPVGVRVVQCRRDIAGEAHGIINRQLTFALEELPQRLAADVRHHVEQEPVDGAGIVQREDVGMVQPGRDVDSRRNRSAPSDDATSAPNTFTATLR